MGNYNYWTPTQDIPITWKIQDVLGNPVSASLVNPYITIRRISDGYYWNSASFVNTSPTWLSMSVAPSSSGVFLYTFSQSLLAVSASYGVTFYNTTTYNLYDYEIHSVMVITAPTTAQISASVWNANRADHIAAGTVGQTTQFTSSFIDVAISTRSSGSSFSGLLASDLAAISSSVWNAARPNHIVVGSMGEAQQFTSSFIDTSISSRASINVSLSASALTSISSSVWANVNVSSSVWTGIVLSVPPTTAQISASVWNANRADHILNGTMGQSQQFSSSFIDINISTRSSGAVGLLPSDLAAISASVWNASRQNHIGDGTIGQSVQFSSSYIDTYISSRTTGSIPNDSEISSSVWTNISIPTTSQISASIWNARRSDHIGAGTVGQSQQFTSSFIDVAISSRTVPSDILADGNKISGSYIDINISTRSSGAVGLLPSDLAAISASVWNAIKLNHINIGSMGESLQFTSSYIDTFISSRTTGSIPAIWTLSQLSASVWNANRADHILNGTMGQSQQFSSSFIDINISTRSSGAVGLLPSDLAAISASVWNASRQNHIGDGTIGQSVQFSSSYIDTYISSRTTGSIPNDSEISSSVWTNISIPTTSQISASIWNARRSDHIGAGTVGQSQQFTSSFIDVAISSRTVPSDILADGNKISGSYIDINISTRSSGAVGLLPSDLAAISASVWNAIKLNHINIGSMGESLQFTSSYIDTFISSRTTGSIPAIWTLSQLSASVWNANRLDHIGLGTMGETMQFSSSYIDVNISTRSSGAVGLSPSDLSAISSSVWNARRSDHTIDGTTGQSQQFTSSYIDVPVSTRNSGSVSISGTIMAVVDLSAISASVWNANKADHTGSNTMGQVMQFSASYIDVPISTRSSGSLTVYFVDPEYDGYDSEPE